MAQAITRNVSNAFSMDHSSGRRQSLIHTGQVASHLLASYLPFHMGQVDDPIEVMQVVSCACYFLFLTKNQNILNEMNSLVTRVNEAYTMAEKSESLSCNQTFINFMWLDVIVLIGMAICTTESGLNGLT